MAYLALPESPRWGPKVWFWNFDHRQASRSRQYHQKSTKYYKFCSEQIREAFIFGTLYLIDFSAHVCHMISVLMTQACQSFSKRKVDGASEKLLRGMSLFYV